ncbi:Retrovirus-related Pol polyprotein from transposon TNT 1-94 [Vitis vinifera]|uniref:Retrovirus-related Pol polyprotein from transposon TNT 1-94 n=1 Tax=Vitis vinifera TaxID=29760 RepID=A0A438GP75_VITVI|nr:Retrovirus-related Pol polyprotein from transposon TNT 1-94 [Vitis vinifera]
MVDSKTVTSEVQELQIILHELHAEKMELSESFQVTTIVEKLPPSWKDFKNSLKHKRKEMGLEDLIVRLKIEEDNCVSEKKVGKHPMESKVPPVMFVEKETCSLVPINGRNLIMGNSATSRVVGIGKVVLNMTSGKELVLTDVLHVSDIRKNLVFGSMLSKNRFKLVFEPDKFVFMKIGMYVGKGFMTNGLFNMNVMTVKHDFNNNKVSTSVYLIESFTFWHNRSKDEALDVFKHYKNEVENQLSRKIKAIRSDRGGKYEAPFGEFCSKHGIIHQTTAPYSPQSNGVAKRKSCTLKEMMNVMLISLGLP